MTHGYLPQQVSKSCSGAGLVNHGSLPQQVSKSCSGAGLVNHGSLPQHVSKSCSGAGLVNHGSLPQQVSKSCSGAGLVTNGYLPQQVSKSCSGAGIVTHGSLPQQCDDARDVVITRRIITIHNEESYALEILTNHWMFLQHGTTRYVENTIRENILSENMKHFVYIFFIIYIFFEAKMGIFQITILIINNYVVIFK